MDLKQYKKKIPEINERIEEFFEELSKDNHKYPFLLDLKQFVLNGGKRIRGILVLMGYDIAKGNKELQDEILSFSVIVELTHAMLLIHDDIMDDSNIRRGKPTLHKVYEKKYGSKTDGINWAILAGDILIFLTNNYFFKPKVPIELKLKAFDYMNNILKDTGLGQSLDLKKEHDEASITEVYRLKTSRYTIEGPLVLGAILGGASDELIQELKDFAHPVGIAFQLQDDLIDAFSNNSGKEKYLDFKEGKQTLPIIKTLKLVNKEDKKFITSKLGTKMSDEDGKKIANLIKSSGAKEYCDDLIEKYYSQANFKELNSFVNYLKKRKK